MVISGYYIVSSIGCRWLKHLNEYGLCLLTDLPTEVGTIKQVDYKNKLED
jgi:hypothetical protein